MHLWLWTYAMLEARHNPGTFAGEMPGHEEFVYSDFIEAAENAADALALFIDRYVTAETENNDFNAMLGLEQQLKKDVATEFPGPSSRMEDAAAAMQTPEFQAVAKADKAKLEQMIKTSAKQMGGDIYSAIQDLFH